MTDFRAKEEEHGGAAADPAAEVENTNHEEPLDEDNREKDYLEINSNGEPLSHSGSDENEKRPQIDRTRSYATNTSTITRTDSHVEPPKKPWYKNFNPLRWGGVPPVPETRAVCREYNAPFLSLVYFQWIAPLMTVSSPPRHPTLP